MMHDSPTAAALPTTPLRSTFARLVVTVLAGAILAIVTPSIALAGEPATSTETIVQPVASSMSSDPEGNITSSGVTTSESTPAPDASTTDTPASDATQGEKTSDTSTSSSSADTGTGSSGTPTCSTSGSNTCGTPTCASSGSSSTCDTTTVTTVTTDTPEKVLSTAGTPELGGGVNDLPLSKNPTAVGGGRDLPFTGAPTTWQVFALGISILALGLLLIDLVSGCRAGDLATRYLDRARGVVAR